MCDKTIGMYEIGKVEYPHIICSGTMGPCISIAIYDTKNKNGYMTHQPFNDSIIEDFIINTLNEVEKENAIVYVCGGSYSKNNEDGDKKSILKNRKFVKDLVVKHFKKENIKIKWAQNGKYTELILNTSNGKFNVVN